MVDRVKILAHTICIIFTQSSRIVQIRTGLALACPGASWRLRLAANTSYSVILFKTNRIEGRSGGDSWDRECITVKSRGPKCWGSAHRAGSLGTLQVTDWSSWNRPLRRCGAASLSSSLSCSTLTAQTHFQSRKLWLSEVTWPSWGHGTSQWYAGIRTWGSRLPSMNLACPKMHAGEGQTYYIFWNKDMFRAQSSILVKGCTLSPAQIHKYLSFVKALRSPAAKKSIGMGSVQCFLS